LVSPDIIFSSYTYCRLCMNVPPMVRASPTASCPSPPPSASSPSLLGGESSFRTGESPTRQTARVITPTPAHM
jgi:hypothetical protein